jgi:hypothetical protein
MQYRQSLRTVDDSLKEHIAYKKIQWIQNVSLLGCVAPRLLPEYECGTVVMYNHNLYNNDAKSYKIKKKVVFCL